MGRYESVWFKSSGGNLEMGEKGVANVSGSSMAEDVGQNFREKQRDGIKPRRE
jgi:hypothetical protein